MDLMPESNRTVEYVRYLNEMGLIQKKLVGAVVKDTVSVPVGGYVVIRFYANNPGNCNIASVNYIYISVLDGIKGKKITQKLLSSIL